MFQPHTYFQRAHSICPDFCGAWQPKWQPRPTSDCRVDVYRVPQMRHSPQELHQNYLGQVSEMWSVDSHSFWTSWSDMDSSDFLSFSSIIRLSTRFDQICSFQLPPYPAITLRVLSRYGLTLKLALRNVSVRWVCATSVPLGCQGMSGGHWKSDKRSINQVIMNIIY